MTRLVDEVRGELGDEGLLGGEVVLALARQLQRVDGDRRVVDLRERHAHGREDLEARLHERGARVEAGRAVAIEHADDLLELGRRGDADLAEPEALHVHPLGPVRIRGRSFIRPCHLFQP